MPCEFDSQSPDCLLLCTLNTVIKHGTLPWPWSCRKLLLKPSGQYNWLPLYFLRAPQKSIAVLHYLFCIRPKRLQICKKVSNVAVEFSHRDDINIKHAPAGLNWARCECTLSFPKDQIRTKMLPKFLKCLLKTSSFESKSWTKTKNCLCHKDIRHSKWHFILNPKSPSTAVSWKPQLLPVQWLWQHLWHPAVNKASVFMNEY